MSPQIEMEVETWISVGLKDQAYYLWIIIEYCYFVAIMEAFGVTPGGWFRGGVGPLLICASLQLPILQDYVVTVKYFDAFDAGEHHTLVELRNTVSEKNLDSDINKKRKEKTLPLACQAFRFETSKDFHLRFRVQRIIVADRPHFFQKPQISQS